MSSACCPRSRGLGGGAAGEQPAMEMVVRMVVVEAGMPGCFLQDSSLGFRVECLDLDVSISPRPTDLYALTLPSSGPGCKRVVCLISCCILIL